jgi:hypothetical protein
VSKRRAFWVLSRESKEISRFGRMKVPAQFKTVEEANRYCRELNFRKGAFHPGYFVEERIGDQPVSKKSKDDADEEAD